MLSKSLFANFLYSAPAEDSMTTDAYVRDHEIDNNVYLMNLLYDCALSAWDPTAGQNSDEQRRLDRLFRSKSIMAWSELVHGAICGKLELNDAEDRERPFYRELTATNKASIKKAVERLVGWSMWVSPAGSEIERVLSDNKSAVKEWFKNKGLTTGYLMGAAE